MSLLSIPEAALIDKHDRVLLEKAAEYVKALLDGDSTGHGYDHAIRVFYMTLRICGTVRCSTADAALAALLHDADDPKLFDTEDNANAGSFLRENGVGEERADRICGIINSVSFSRNAGKRPDTPEGMAVQDADRLDAMGAVGVARTFAYGGARGRSLKESSYHFVEKLLKLRDLMNTAAGREIAGERHEFLVSFLNRFRDETDTPDS